MEKIRCPMCSKLNPASNDTCQYCGARLKPLAVPPEDAAPSTTGGIDAPDWKSQFEGLEDLGPAEDSSAAEPEPEPGAQDANDWLARLQEETGGALPEEEPEKPDEASTNQDNLPDWLKNVRAAASRDLNDRPLGIPVVKPESGTDEDWLERLRSQKAEDERQADYTPSTTPSVPPEEPDWLHAFPYQKDSPSEESNPPGYTSQALPDWLSGAQPSAPTGEPESEWNPPSRDEEPSEIPDWLGSEAPSRPQEDSSMGTGSKPPFEGSLDFDAGGPESGKPDWLAELEGRATVSEPQGPTLSFDPIDSAVERGSLDTFAGEDLPDWLANFGPAAPLTPIIPDTPISEPAAESQDEDLTPADLPGWLRAMRPVETILPAAGVRRENDQREDKSGPLAGLRGTLPAEPSMGGFTRPPSYIARLQPSESQERYKSIFEQLIANEREPQPARAKPLISSQRAVRLAIGILFLAVILFPALTGLAPLPAPGLVPQETLDLYTAVEMLQAGSPVLVGVEYEPSLAGEMETAAASVIDHLMIKGARISLLSTSPTGPALASHLLNTVLAQPEAYHETYSSGQNAAVLGYLAGGPAGLMEFSLRPQLALPALLNGGPTVDGVRSLSDFSMVVLITDDQDTGRIWLEQIQPRMGSDAPLLLVSSAQAAPVLSAYLDSGQVDGQVTGLAGGTTYEQIRQRAGLGTGRWQSYQLVMAASLAVILIGAAVVLILDVLANRKKEDKD